MDLFPGVHTFHIFTLTSMSLRLPYTHYPCYTILEKTLLPPDAIQLISEFCMDKCNVCGFATNDWDIYFVQCDKCKSYCCNVHCSSGPYMVTDLIFCDICSAEWNARSAVLRQIGRLTWFGGLNHNLLPSVVRAYYRNI